jgi:hypothetical protein
MLAQQALGQLQGFAQPVGLDFLEDPVQLRFGRRIRQGGRRPGGVLGERRAGEADGQQAGGQRTEKEAAGGGHVSGRFLP